jgi:XTP/dITP diphosphohydrolase
MEIVFATNNNHKLIEIRDAIASKYKIVGLKDLGIVEEIPENENTLEGNSIQKAKYIYKKYKFICFADDTGLEVETLDGKPGIYTARYAGEGCTFEDNVNKLLHEMRGVKNRNARFRTVIALVESESKISTFEGIIEGKISETRLGNEGFGYDPVFIPEGSNLSFAQMSLSKKNQISHRAKALKKLTDYLVAQNFK